jgi:steroid delta-isomerase-like uncharacterized protein
MQQRAHAGQAQQAGGAGPLVRALYEAYNAHLADDAGALYDDDGHHREVASGRVAQGRKAIVDGLDGFFKLFPDARWEPLQQIFAESAAAVSYRLTGTLSAALGPIPACGQRLDLRGVHVLRVGATAISASEDYWDQATFRAQMRVPEGGG